VGQWLENMDRAILKNVRVLDFGRFIAAPYCGMILADLGADVIRVERPGGEEDRWLGLKAVNGESYTFSSLARNKKGITLDIFGPKSGRRVLADLVHRCDVFLHNFSTNAAQAFKITYEDIQALRPDVIYTGISCYGSEGPQANRNGVDPMAQMASGAGAVMGFEGEAPLRSGVPWVDFGTGLCAALGTVTALLHREKTGQGQAVDCTLLHTAISYMAPFIAEAVIGGKERPRLGNQPPYLAPCNLYSCTDGYVYLAAITRTAWNSLTKVINCPELGSASDYATPELRFERREDIDSLIQRWTAPLTVKQVLEALETARIPCSLHNSTLQVPSDPQVKALQLLEDLDLEIPGLEQVPVSRVPIRLSKSPRIRLSRPPRVGEHNRQIYSELLEYSDDLILDLQSQHII
jgi:crotonobetainyl-CoA:carnitine CoA-transferase CaiB-like acyl-CoA transferase